MIKSLGKNDIENKTKQTKHPHYNCENKESDLLPEKQNLLMKHSQCLKNVLHAETIERKALDLLNYPTAPVISPTTGTAQEEELRNLLHYYFRQIFGKTYLQGFHIFQNLQSLCCYFIKRTSIK